MDKKNNTSDSIQQIGSAELIALITAFSVALAYAFHLGYFAVGRYDYVTLLTVQDIAVSSFIGGGLFLALIIAAGGEGIENLASQSERKYFWGSIGVGAILVVLIIVETKQLGSNLSIVVGGAAILLSFLTIGHAIKSKKTVLYRTLRAALILFLCAFVCGVASYNLSVKGSKQLTQFTMTDDTTETHKVARITSNYVFYLDGQEMNVLALSGVRKIEQIKD